MRKWKQGIMAIIIFFVAFPFVTVTGNPTVSTVAVSAMLFSVAYGLVLVAAFTFQQIHKWSRRRLSKLKMEEKVVRTKIITLYECDHCKRQYSNSQTCPHCGSPNRKTLKEKTEEETVEKWKTS